MTVVSKVAVVPLFFFSAITLVTALRPATPVLNTDLQVQVQVQTFKPADWSAQYREVAPDQQPSDSEQKTPTENTDNMFEVLDITELMQLNQDELLMYMLEYRNQRMFEIDFMAEEYELFQTVLDIEPFAALDYMVAIGHDASTEFFYNFLYTDFMVHNGKSDEVVEYINRFGPNVSLMNLITFANLSDQMSIQVQREVLSEYVLGNVEYHQIIKIAQWEDNLTPDEKVSAFINTVPAYIEDPYGLIRDVADLANPATYDHILRFIVEHPDRYRIYRLIKSLDGIDVYPVIEQMMSRFDTMTINDQVQTALIAMDLGFSDALGFLASTAQKPLILNRAINVEYAVLSSVTAPQYMGKDLAWVTENIDAFVFNPYTRKFEY